MVGPLNPGPSSGMSPPGSTPRGPSTTGLWVGSALIVLSVVGGFLWVLVAAVGLVGQFVNGPHVPVGSTGQVQLSARAYGVWVVALDNSRVPEADLALSITSESGEQVALSPPPPAASALSNQPTFRPLGDVRIDEAGTYEVSTVSSSGESADIRVVFADPIEAFETDLTARILIGGAVAFIVFAAGMGLLVVTLARRSNFHRSQSASAQDLSSGRWVSSPGNSAEAPDESPGNQVGPGTGAPGVAQSQPTDPWSLPPRDPWADR
ncbi:MAG: hypothetical protein N2037_01230 [Acidimicrobiales bacterium]|nr:hypothetical protein [Acidimicrobiales bacterium]